MNKEKLELEQKKCHFCEKQIMVNDEFKGTHLHFDFYACEECVAKEKAEMDKVYQEMAAMEREVHECNVALLKSIGRSAQYMVRKMLYGCTLTSHEKMVIVDSPKGENQNERNGIFKELWVEQWSTGMEGDSYAGYMYAKFDENKYLKIPYWC